MPHAVTLMRLLCVVTLLPHIRITMSVEAREHNDLFVGDDVENAVGKAAQESATNVPMNHWESLWIRLNGMEALLKGKQEVVSKIVASLAVPGEDAVDIDLSGADETESHFFRFNDSRTSSQGRAALGSVRCSERRRSSSCR